MEGEGEKEKGKIAPEGRNMNCFRGAGQLKRKCVEFYSNDISGKSKNIKNSSDEKS
jgi:hypothetical protein